MINLAFRAAGGHPARPPNEAKRDLARRLTDRFWGDGAGDTAEARFDAVHKRGEIPEDIPVTEWEEAGDAVHLPALMGEVFDISRSEARRLLDQGGVRVDGQVHKDLDIPRDQLHETVLQVGKRRHARISVVAAKD